MYGMGYGCFNPARTGKTLTVVRTIVERLKSEPWIEGVVSNVPLNFKPLGLQDMFIYLDDIEILRMLKGYYIVFIDEIRRYTDSRMSSSQKNRLISNLTADLFKQKCDLYVTDQDSHAPDRRIRVNLNFVLAPEYQERIRVCVVRVFSSIEEYEMWTNYGPMYAHPSFTYAYNAEPYFKYFDTEEKIDDYVLRFNVERTADNFTEWLRRKGLTNLTVEEMDNDLFNLWSTTTGIEISGQERSALRKYLELNRMKNL